MKIVFFEDAGVGNLNPITLIRPAFDILCGGLTLRQLAEKVFKTKDMDFRVRDYLGPAVQKNFKIKRSGADKILFLNARLVPDIKSAEMLAKQIKSGQSRIFEGQKGLVGALVDLQELKLKENQINKLNCESIGNFLSSLKLKKTAIDWKFFERPWQVIVSNQDILKGNLKILSKDYRQLKPGVFVGKNVSIAERVEFDSTAGLIIIGDNTEILPFSYLVGPLFFGPGCLIKEFSSIKGPCSFGPVCRVGGELKSLIIQGYSNKQHYGFLGHSYLGEWVNLGAGTCNSDLKNNYSVVKMGGDETGEQFLGCVIGDYSKSAINAAIFTGKIIGVNSFLYGMITEDVPSFTNCASQLGCKVEFLIDEALKVQQVIMARRMIIQTEVDRNLLKKIFEMTKAEREEKDVRPGRVIFK